MISGIGALNSTTDTDCGLAPPKMVIGRRKRGPEHDFTNTEITGE